jgi:hypothetical protein
MKYMKFMFIVKRQVIRGHQFLTIPRPLADKLNGRFMKVRIVGNRLIYEPILEGGDFSE